ncbi:MAG: sulfatase-like hydrolase/transferase [Planctomycetota bacterium]
MARETTRRRFLAEAGLGVAAAAAGCGKPREKQMAKRPPNIVFILSDDQGYGDLGCYGAPDLRTPHIDGLAAQGVRFTHYYANGPECTPTRTALMTGRYQQRVGGLECAIGTTNVGRYDDAIRLAEAHDLGLPVSESVLPVALKDVGYAAAVYGKWHLGYEPKFLPRRHGWDHFVGILGGHCDYFHYVEITGAKTLYENERPTDDDRYMTDLITEESIDFLRRQDATRPFFLYVSYTAPHSPYQGPGDRKPSRVPKAQWNQGTREDYCVLVEYMDRCVGQILKTLEEKGFAEDTVVFFVSDNGGTRQARNAPFSGHKGTTFEGGIRVPCIIRWPGVIEPKTVCDQPCVTFDLTRSLLRIAGAGPPARGFDGIDIVGHVAEGKPTVERTLFWRGRRGQRTWRAVRDGDLKYVSKRDGDAFEEWLFDLSKDPGEHNSLLDARPDDAKRLKGLLAAWEKDVQPSR